MKKITAIICAVIMAAMLPLWSGASSGETLSITMTSMPDAVKGVYYSQKIKTNMPDGAVEFSEWFNPGQTVTLSDLGLSLSEKGRVSGTPKKVGQFTFYFYAEVTETGEGEYFTMKIRIVDAPEETPVPVVTIPRPDCVFVADYVSYYEQGKEFDLLLIKDLGAGTSPAGFVSPLPDGVRLVFDPERGELRLRGVITREDAENGEIINPLGWLMITVGLETDGTEVFISYRIIPKPQGESDSYPAGTPIVRGGGRL